MLSQPDERVRRSLAMLGGNAHFQCVCEWLESERARIGSAMAVERSDTELRMQQGAVQALNRIVDAAKRAAS